MSPVFPFSHISCVYKFQAITRGCCSSSAFGEPADAYSNVFYYGNFRRWNSWASNFSEITYFSPQEEHIAVYLIPLVQLGSSYSSIQQAFHSISFFDNACGDSNLCKSAFLLAVLEGCKRFASNPSYLSGVTILPELFAALVNRFATPTAIVQPHFDYCNVVCGVTVTMAFLKYCKGFKIAQLAP